MTVKLRNFNLRHPERGSTEAFVGNLSDDNYERLPYPSKRRGMKAYTAAGVPLPGITPVFVLREEIERHPEGKELIWRLSQHGLWLVRYNFNRRHPELQEGEIFLGNETAAGFARMHYASKRLGRTAYGTDGSEIGSAFPVFVQRSELENVTDGQRILKTLLREGIT